MISQLCYALALTLGAASVACEPAGVSGDSAAATEPQEAQARRRPASPAEGMVSPTKKTYQHPGGFTLEHPSGWDVKEDSGFIRLIPPGSDTDAEHYRVITAALSLRPTDPEFGEGLDAQFASTGFRRTGAARPFTARSGQGAAFVFDGDDPQTGSSVRMLILAVSLGRQTVLVVGAGPSAPIEERAGELRDIAASITAGRAATAQPPGGGNDSPLERQWAEKLRGRKLTYMTSYSSGSTGGYSAKTVIMLGEDGSFSFYSNSSVSVDSGAMGSSGGADSGEGRWRVYSQDGQAVLELRFNSGEVSRYELAYEGGKTFLNGQRFSVTDP